MDRDERDLVRRCLAGDQAACTELVDAHARMVGTVIWRATGRGDTVEDLSQETFLRVFRALPYFTARSKLSTWIYTIAHRVAIDYRRKAGRAREDLSSAFDIDSILLERFSGSDFGDPETAAIRGEIDRLVHDGLAHLPDKCRLPLVYAAIDGLDYLTIAAMLGVPTGTVKTLVFRGKQMLRKHIVAALEARAAGREVPDAV